MGISGTRSDAITRGDKGRVAVVKFSKGDQGYGNYSHSVLVKYLSPMSTFNWSNKVSNDAISIYRHFLVPNLVVTILYPLFAP